MQRRKTSKEGWAKIFSIDEPNTGCSGPSSGARRAQEREREGNKFALFYSYLHAYL